MFNVLVSGGAGFIGSHIAEYLVRSGRYENVVVLDDLSGGYRHNVPFGVVEIVGPNCSICNYDQILKLFDQYKFDYVFHFAAYAAEGLSHFIRRFNYENNLIGSINLINASILNRVTCFVYASSAAIYGYPRLKPFSEYDTPIPIDPYGVAKLAVEMDLATANHMFNLPSIIFRMHNVYGEKQNIFDKYRNVVGIFMKQVLHNEPITIFGDGKQTRQFTYIHDIVGPICDSIRINKMYNNIYNIGASGGAYSINTLASKIKRIMGKDDTYPIDYIESRKEAKYVELEHNKLWSHYDKVTNTTDLDIGLQNMYKWVKNTGMYLTKKFDNIEIEENLPESWR
jgi:UDP-glucose 4-epimerase